MYLAGALHDIGEMAIGNEILKKPDCHNIMGVARYRLEYNIEKCCKPCKIKFCKILCRKTCNRRECTSEI